MNAQILLTFRLGDHGQGCLASSIQKGKPDIFSGVLHFAENIDFLGAAELFGGQFAYPKDLEQQGFLPAQKISSRAEVWYRISDSAFRITVSLENLWSGNFGLGRFSVDQLKGSVSYLGNVKDVYQFSLDGTFHLSGYRAIASLALSNDQSQSVLSLYFDKFSISAIVDNTVGAGAYLALPVPVNYQKPTEAVKVNAKLNLTDQTFLLQGSYQAAPGNGKEPVKEEFQNQNRNEAQAALYFTKAPGKFTYWIGAELKNFTFTDISEALQGVDSFLGLQNAGAAVILSDMDQELTEVPSFLMIKGQRSVRRGLTFQIELEFSDSYLKKVIDLEGNCVLSGFIPQAQDEEIELSGSVETGVFLEFFKLSAVQVLIKRGGKEAERNNYLFQISGLLCLELSGLGNLPAFQALLKIERQGMYKKLLLKGGLAEGIREPLGIPKTTLDELCFYVSTSSDAGGEEAAEIYFEGKATIAELQARAFILFDKRVPAVVKVEIQAQEELAISKLTEKYLDLQWPDLLDIRLTNGMIWYCKSNVTIGTETYLQGFHALVNTKIFSLPWLLLTVNINQGLLFASAQFTQMLDLSFISFSWEGSGPKVSIEVGNGKSTFTLFTEVTVFTHLVGKVFITARKQYMEGVLTFPANFPLSSRVGFTWNQNGVSLNECPINGFSKMDFKIPKLNIKSGGCDFSTSKGFKFKTKPDVKSRGMLMDSEKLGVKFAVLLTVKSEAGAFSNDDSFDLVFDNLSVSFQKDDFKSFTITTLITELGKNITSLVGSLFEQAISGQVFQDDLNEDNLKKIAKFLTMAGISWSVKKLVNYLICKQLKSMLAEAFAASLTSASESLWEGLGISLFLGGILGSMDQNGNFTTNKKAPKENKDDPKKNPGQPGVPGVCFDGNDLVVEWTPCENAKGYRPVVIRVEEERNTSLAVSESPITSCRIAGADEKNLYSAAYGFEYQVMIYAWNDTGAKTGPAAGIYLLKRPTGVAVRYQCETRQLSVSWNPLNKSESYVVEVERDGQETFSQTARQCSSSFLNFIPECQLSFRVRGARENVIGPWSLNAPLYLYDLKAPGTVTGFNTQEGITLAWEAVSHADGYRVSGQDQEGNRLPLFSCKENTIIIEDGKLTEGRTYLFSVQAVAQWIEGKSSEAFLILRRFIPVLEILSLICGEDGILVFTFSDGTNTYIQMLSNDGIPIELGNQGAQCQWDFHENTCRGSLIEQGEIGPWSREISLIPINTPKEFALTVLGETLHGTWRQEKEEVFYGIELQGIGCQNIIEPISGTECDIDISKLQKGERYWVFLYAVDSTDQRRKSNAVSASFEKM